MKKILHITAHLGGGAGKAISGIIKYLGNYENTVILLEDPVLQKYSDSCRDNNAKIIITSDAQQIASAALDHDAVILHWWGHPLFVNVLKALSSVPARIGLWSHINGLNYPCMLYDFLNIFDTLIFTSPCVYENKNWTDPQRSDIRTNSSVVYGMGDFYPEKVPCKSDYSISDKFIIGYTGTLNFSKLNPEFPQMTQKIHSCLNDAVFDLYGQCSDDMISRFDSGYINFKGFINNVEDVLKDMDIFLYPLVKENFATTENSLIEAMAAGLPVIVLDNPPERNIVIHNQTGLIAKTPYQAVEYVKLLYDDHELRKTLGVNAREYIINNYSVRNNSERFIESVKKLLNVPCKIHEFEKVTGETPWDFFSYFCGSDIEKINMLLSGKTEMNLPDIYYGKNKSSPEHFLRYFPDDEKLNQIISVLKIN